MFFQFFNSNIGYVCMCYLRPQHPVVIAIADVLGFDNWTPTTSISDLLVVVMKKSTAGISIS
ncbi:TPA: hypothetical protein J1719_003432 [Escherichia coli]|nr:hypothetical protein [Escherichia coli]